MALTPYTSSQSGARITVNSWLKDPARIQAYMLSLLDQGFLADAVLRSGGSAPSGVVRYEETTPIYSDATVTNRAEGAEVPVATVSRGAPVSAYSQDKSLRYVITDEMQRRNQMDLANQGITQVVNTIIKAFDDMFITTTLAAPISSQAASAVWATTSTDVRGDILAAAKKIEGAQDSQGAELGYLADTLIVNRATKFDLINNTTFNAPLTYNLANENLRYTGKLPNQVLGFDVLFSPRVPSGTAILCQRNSCGAIFDEVGLTVMPMEEDRKTLSWYSIVRRVSAIAIDQPKAICKITGV